MERHEIQFTFELQETQKHGRNAEERTWRGKRFSLHFHFKRHRSTGEMQTKGYGEARDSVHTFTSRDTAAREKCRQEGMERQEIQFTFELQETQQHGRSADKRAWRGEGFNSHFHFKRHRSTGEMLTRQHGEGRDSVHI